MEQQRDPWFFKGSRFCAGEDRAPEGNTFWGMPEGQVRCPPFGYFTFYAKKVPRNCRQTVKMPMNFGMM